MPSNPRDGVHSSAIIEADVIVIGAGLSGLVAAAQAYADGKRVAVLDQEPAASVGGQAHWSFGGLFLVNSPEQRRLGVRDSAELALSDWLASAAFDRPEDSWAKLWAEAYIDFAAGEKRPWLRSLGVRLFPLVQWAERGGYGPQGHGNTVPRFHVAWGTGPAVVEPFLAKVGEGVTRGRVSLHFRHRATELTTTAGRVTGTSGEILEASDAERGEASSRAVVGRFEATAGAIIVTTGGIGGNHAKVRRQWPSGTAPEHLLSGVPTSVDGDFLTATAAAGGGAHQWGPHVALPGRHPQPLPRVAFAWHPHPARTVVAVAGRRRAPTTRPAVPGLRFAGRAQAYPGERL